ncbi:Uncharacterised protein [Mycobacteroides abscessus subsp. massiliense]|nr:Uncharacterised protein [Mycobacteroides abscessus subsp. massiliense]
MQVLPQVPPPGQHRVDARALPHASVCSPLAQLGDQRFHVVLGDGLHLYVPVAVNHRSQRC